MRIFDHEPGSGNDLRPFHLGLLGIVPKKRLFVGLISQVPKIRYKSRSGKLSVKIGILLATTILLGIFSFYIVFGDNKNISEESKKNSLDGLIKSGAKLNSVEAIHSEFCKAIQESQGELAAELCEKAIAEYQTKISPGLVEMMVITGDKYIHSGNLKDAERILNILDQRCATFTANEMTNRTMADWLNPRLGYIKNGGKHNWTFSSPQTLANTIGKAILNDNQEKLRFLLTKIDPEMGNWGSEIYVTDSLIDYLSKHWNSKLTIDGNESAVSISGNATEGMVFNIRGWSKLENGQNVIQFVLMPFQDGWEWKAIIIGTDPNQEVAAVENLPKTEKQVDAGDESILPLDLSFRMTYAEIKEIFPKMFWNRHEGIYMADRNERYYGLQFSELEPQTLIGLHVYYYTIADFSHANEILSKKLRFSLVRDERNQTYSLVSSRGRVGNTLVEIFECIYSGRNGSQRRISYFEIPFGENRGKFPKKYLEFIDSALNSINKRPTNDY